MNLLYIIYALVTSVLFIILFPFFLIYSYVTGQYTYRLKERFGFVPQKAIQKLTGSPRIWIHAVSLGELKVAAAIIESLKRLLPNCSILISTTTEHGRKLAIETFSDDIPVIYAPVDLVGSAYKALRVIRPDAMVFLETELWPAWLFEARCLGTKIIMLNGRISFKTIKKYLKFRPFFRHVLNNFDMFSMTSEENASRIEQMGADPKKVKVNGNAKYDLLTSSLNQNIKKQMLERLDLNQKQNVFISGSSRGREEIMILNAYKKVLGDFPETVLIIAPRHIKRVQTIITFIKDHGLGYQLWTDLKKTHSTRTEQIIIVDTFGELFNIYSVGSIVLLGGSIVPLGGQNPLEPAAWGNVAFYGPFMDNFLDAKAILEDAKAGVMVQGPEELASKLIWFFSHPEELKAYGDRGKKAIKKNEKSADKHAMVIKRLILEK